MPPSHFDHTESLAEFSVKWVVYQRDGANGSWRVYSTEASEHNALGVKADIWERPEGREYEVRRVTTIGERVA